MFANKHIGKDGSGAGEGSGRTPFFRSSMVQPKLQVNTPGDSYEQEADTMADHVMSTGSTAQTNPSFFKPSITGIQRKCQHCEEEDKLIHRKENTNSQPDGGNELDNYVSSISSSGTALPESSRMFFEPHFRYDFSGVRVHTDQAAAQSAQSINALAYTTGNNIVFNSGQFSPESDSGKRLIAHELTHVVQQNTGKIAKKDAGQSGVIQMQPEKHDKSGPPTDKTKSPPTPPPAATAAVFSEDPGEQFAGYDDSGRPDNWLVVPKGETRIAKVDITPADAKPTYESEDKTKATVAATATGITVKGMAKGETKIHAKQGKTILATLQISVKPKLSKSVGFYYVCDSAKPHPRCSNKKPAAGDMKDLLNNVWQRQANVEFTGGAGKDVTAEGTLGPEIDDTEDNKEWDAVTSLGGGNNYNVFRVWAVRSPRCPGDPFCSGAITSGSDTLLADQTCKDGLGLPHEAGHFLGAEHTDNFIMTTCDKHRKDKRVSKAIADKVNP